jgi:peptidoglycan hydrolase-like protein with peptidoglycan-binding domain
VRSRLPFTRARVALCTAALTVTALLVPAAVHPAGAATGSDDTVFTFGSAGFYGSTSGKHLNSPLVGMANTPDGKGYWLVAADGGIFSYGTARFYGSTGAIRLNQPIVGMASTPGGRGYWLVARDGGVFTFGDAQFKGSAAGKVPLDRRIAQIAGLRNGKGYRMLALPIPLDTVVLRPGAAGAAVTNQQNRLVSLGFWLGSVDGRYGLTTTQAVMALQKVYGIPRTGVFDVRTQAVLAVASRPKPRSTSGYLIEVDLARQVIMIARNGATEWVINTSTGGGYTYSYGGQTFTAITPTGHFTVLRQIDGLRVGRLGSLWRPKYITNDGIALHGAPSVPSYPASHGCIRMTNAAIDWIWANNVAPLGTAVWVY